MRIVIAPDSRSSNRPDIGRGARALADSLHPEAEAIVRDLHPGNEPATPTLPDMVHRSPASVVPSDPGRLVVPALLAGWATAASWGTPAMGWKLVATTVVVTVLAYGKRWPLASLVTAFLGLLVVVALPVPTPEDAFLGMLVYACYLTGRHASMRAQPWAGAGVLLLLSLNVLGPDHVSPADVVFPVLLTAAPWLLGLAVQLARDREQSAIRYARALEGSYGDGVRRATVEERLRIAQELHDVVTHAISGISLQAQVARRAAESGRVVGAAELRSIEHTARQAMGDLRRLLGVLGPSDPVDRYPREGLDQVDALVDSARAMGQDVRLTVHGQPRVVPPALSIAAYRIVQEGLTNARRHGSPGPVHIEIGWEADRLSLCVKNAMHVGASAVEPGHGLAGIEERARMFGGHAEALPDPLARAWTLRVDLPAPAPMRSGP